MKRIHIVSNRLPWNVNLQEQNIELIPSVGGLATGVRSIYKNFKGNWIGWPGIALDKLQENTLQEIDKALDKESCLCVHLTEKEIDLYYNGFCNNTLWPLFHYFMQYTEYNPQMWQVYKSVNQKFADKALETVENGDSVWIHDYQLMLVPEMIKKKKPGVTVGFFLHIPFPSFEVFRLLPWRVDLIQGLLGADLLGFHTYDYTRHFMSSVRSLLGHEISFNQIYLKDRVILADVFPMGIDYNKYKDAASQTSQKTPQQKSDLHRELEKYYLLSSKRELILSIDRLDYTKGIPIRLKAFSLFLEKYPQFRGKVTLILLTVPSRGKVEQYQSLKSEVDQLVGNINGQYGNINYTPVWYFYRTLPFESLIELYCSCNVALITPIRDGMNLVAKEYVASRTNRTGSLVLSEMAGVAKEMGEALIINPNNSEEIVDAIYKALTMSEDEQRERMIMLQDRIKRYDVFKWAQEFVDALEKIQQIQHSFSANLVTTPIRKQILTNYKRAKKRAIFLDYDGTLTPFKKTPDAAIPDQALHNLLTQLAADPKNDVTIISGRDRESLDAWLSQHPINLIAEHGVWFKPTGETWEMLANLKNDWKEKISPVLERFMDRTPGTFIEEKNFSLAWHYRKAEPDQGELRASELKSSLTNLIANLNLELMEGQKVVEVKNIGFNKGLAALHLINKQNYDFILAIGDDWTDEYLFKELPKEACTIKVGMKNTNATYKLESVAAVRDFLNDLNTQSLSLHLTKI